MKKYVINILFLILLTSVSHAAFENEYWGSRAKGMAGTFVAVADDYSTPMWNPAGLDNLGYFGLQFMYNKPFWGFDDEIGLDNMYFSLFYPNYKIGGFALTYTRFSATDLYKEDTYMLSYGVNMNNFFNIPLFYWQMGVNLKLLNRGFITDERSEGDSVFSKGTSSSAFGMDIGTLISPWFDEDAHYWVIGLTVFNINEPDIGLASEDRIERKYSFGLAYNFRFPEFLGYTWITPAIQYSMRSDYNKLSFGLEAWIYDRMIGIRGGWNRDELAMGLSASYHLSKDITASFDYAFLLPSNVEHISGSHMFSLNIKFPGITLKISNADEGQVGGETVGSSNGKDDSSYEEEDDEEDDEGIEEDDDEAELKGSSKSDINSDDEEEEEGDEDDEDVE
ncbi:MAG: type IX secretion system membrane protein PorP/SprF [Spirochaetes bacterium]|nr:type IX secretion system membrane protein PorP/SprF [Spirochaetota bacterium]